MSTNDLTIKQERWINAYLETGNATEAARQAGYGANEDGLRVIGCQNLTKLNIKRRIDARLAEEAITATEALNMLASHARADLTDLFDETGIFDLQTIRERGLGHLIKKIKRTRRYEGRGEERQPIDELEIEIHNPQTALAQICKMRGWEQMPAINERDRDIADAAIAKYLEDHTDATRAEAVEFCRGIVPEVDRLATELIQ
jgi:terminase small subunit-like protein